MIGSLRGEGLRGCDRVTDVVDEVYFLSHFLLFFFHVVLSRSAFCDGL